MRVCPSRIEVHFSITITAQITRASSPISVHPSRATDHLNTQICGTFLKARHKTHCVASKGGHPASHGKKLLYYKTTKAPSNTTTAESTSSLPIFDSVPVSLHPRFPQTATSRVQYILRISQILTGRHPVQL